jgi:hypothetical protein
LWRLQAADGRVPFAPRQDPAVRVMDASKRLVPRASASHAGFIAQGVSAETTGGPVHNDVAFIGLSIVFFVLAGLLTVACDHIIGPDEVEEPVSDETTEEQLAA